MSMTFIGSRNWVSATTTMDGGFSPVILFGPYRVSRAVASALVNPFDGSEPRSAATSLASRAYGGGASGFPVEISKLLRFIRFHPFSTYWFNLASTNRPHPTRPGGSSLGSTTIRHSRALLQGCPRNARCARRPSIGADGSRRTADRSGHHHRRTERRHRPRGRTPRLRSVAPAAPEKNRYRGRDHDQQPGDADQHTDRCALRRRHQTGQQHTDPDNEQGGADKPSAAARMFEGNSGREPRIIPAEHAFHLVKGSLLVVGQSHRHSPAGPASSG